MPSNRNIYRSILLTGVESTPGVAANMSASQNAVLIVDPIASPGGSYAFKTPRDHVITGATRGVAPLPPKGLMGTWAVKFHARGTRDGQKYQVGDLPDFDPILRAAGLSQTIGTTVGAESVSYSPVSSGFVNLTGAYYTDGILRQLVGSVVESLTFDFTAGMPFIIDATILGLYSQADVAFPSAAFYGTSVPPTMDNVNISINGYTAGIIRSFKASLKNETTGTRGSANAVGAVIPPEKRADKTSATIVMEMTNIADIDLQGLAAVPTPFVLSWAVPGSKYNSFSWTSPAAVITDTPKISNEKGTEIATIELDLVGSTPTNDDAFTLKFT